MHPVFDKAWQALRLSQPYNGYNLTWHNPNTTGCEMGMGWKDTLPFSHLFSDDFFTQGTGGVNASDYTNEQARSHRALLPFLGVLSRSLVLAPVRRVWPHPRPPWRARARERMCRGGPAPRRRGARYVAARAAIPS